MLYTPKELQADLKAKGYNVSLRCLVDWRFKGWLEPINRQSRGKGKGVICGWDDKSVRVKALQICKELRK